MGGVYGAHDAFANNPFGGAILSAPEMVGGQMAFNVASKWVGGFRKILAAKGGLQYSDDLVRAAQQTYPKLAGKTQLHHITPKYLGGAKNGALVPLDGAYHQMITNEFRAL